MKRRVLLMSVCALALVMGGCEWLQSQTQARTTSPLTGKSVTEAEFMRETMTAQADAKAKFDADAAEAAKKLAAAKLLALTKAAEIKTHVAVTGEQAQGELAILAATTDAQIADASSAIASATEAFRTAMSAIDKKIDLGNAQLEQARAQTTSFFNGILSMPVVKQGAALAGVDTNSLMNMGLIGGGGLGLLGLHTFSKGRAVKQAKDDRDEHDTTYDQAKAEHTQQVLIPILTALMAGKVDPAALLTSVTKPADVTTKSQPF
jgi:hypothetical protein